jgi:hypothetical protein
MSNINVDEAEIVIGPMALEAYSRLPYTMWHALGEFIDNSTQSRTNYENLVDLALASEAKPLTVEIIYNRMDRVLRIKDNSIGMSKEVLVNSLKIANPTKDSVGRSKYGMGMKTAACWIGKKWEVVTKELSGDEEWTANIDVEAIAHRNAKIPLSMKIVDRDTHYTEIVIRELHRNIQKRTEETIRAYLGSMYRFDIKEKKLLITLNGEEIKEPQDYQMDTDPNGILMRRDIPETIIGGKIVRGWVGVLKIGSGGRKYGGFSLFQNQRQIMGYPSAWKPRSIFGGVDDEGGNNLVAQRLTGEIQLDGFDVSHTKDAILFKDDEEQELEELLAKVSKDYRDHAQKRRGGDKGNPWNREKVAELLADMKSEFTSGEMKDAVNHSILPPIETITANNRQAVAALTPEDRVLEIDISTELKVIVSLQEKSEYEPHATIAAAAQAGTIHLIINRLHPYYSSIESTDAMNECLKQYIYDAIAEYKASRMSSIVQPDSVRRLKNDYLRVKAVMIENSAIKQQKDGEKEAVATITASLF